MEARYLTSADVSRRLGVEGGTVRYYAETLRELGFPMPKEEETGAYLWSPELVEVARAAYAMAKATRGLSFKEAVELILYAGEAAYHARAGRSILTLLHQALALPDQLSHVGAKWLDLAQQVERNIDRAIRGAVARDIQGAASTLWERAAEVAVAAQEVVEAADAARSAIREAQGGGWVGPVALLVVAVAVLVPALGLPFPTALAAAVGLLGVGAFLGWWARG